MVAIHVLMDIPCSMGIVSSVHNLVAYMAHAPLVARKHREHRLVALIVLSLSTHSLSCTQVDALCPLGASRSIVGDFAWNASPVTTSSITCVTLVIHHAPLAQMPLTV